MRTGLALTAALSLTLAACGSSGKTSANGTSSSSSAPANGGGQAARGGTLNMLGTGDVDYMDPNISYYTTGYLALRMWSRQLLTYPATPGHTTDIVPDLATAVPTTSNGGISADGLTYKLTIRNGAMWNTTPPRQVTAADEVRGVERTCNSAQPFGGLPDFETLIAGFQAFCAAFSKVATTAPAIATYINGHSIPGVSVDPSNPLTVVFKLTHPATYFPNQLAMPAFSPAPVELLNYVPASAALAQHTISDGPYEIQSYDPTKSIVFVRNPAWTSSVDSVRQAYVDRVVVSETGNQNAIQQQLETGSPAADMGWDAAAPTAQVPGLLAAKDPKLNLGPTFGTTPYVLFNNVSPNNNKLLANVAVRQALEYAINRTNLVQDDGGPVVAPPLTHILPPGIVGSKQIDPYPYNPTKAKAMLASALGGAHLTLKLLYQSAFDYEVKMFQTLQSDLSKVGVTVTGVGVPSADFYTKYLEVPTVAKGGVWDIALANWFPDWYGNAALSFFEPLFGGTPAFPPSGSNFGFYENPKTDQLIQQASSATTASAAAALWEQADAQVMADAAIFPITSPTSANYHASQVHNAVYVPQLFQFDPTNVWLTPSDNGG
jgi:peptide/nickel transport system substrate-binding protein